MNDNFKVGLVVVAIALMAVLLIMIGIRQFSLAITTVDVIAVEPGVRCARMVTADGAAISCWEAGNE